MKRTSDSRDRGGFMVKKAKVTSRIGHHLLTRQPPNLTQKVPLDGVVISVLKQQLPAFYAMEISSLNKRFHLTKFEKPTVSMVLGLRIDDDDFLDIHLTDQRKAVSDTFKKRTVTVPVAYLVETLAIITGQGMIRQLWTWAKFDSVPVLNALLKLENFSPSALFLSVLEDCPQELFAAIIRRFASKLHQVAFDFDNRTLALGGGDTETEMNWQQLNGCLQPLTNLKWFALNAAGAMPPSDDDWLKNLLQTNSQLKLFRFNDRQLNSPVITEAVSTVASVPVIRITAFALDQIVEHVDADLRGQGPCTLTTIALNMPETSSLKMVIVDFSPDDLFCGDALRLVYYLLSLAKTGSKVVVKAYFVPVEQMEQFLEDLRHYHPKMSLTWHSDGSNSVANYVVRVGSVKMRLCSRIQSRD